MKRLIALAMAMCLFAGILAGCASKPSAPGDSQTSNPGAATTEIPTVRLMVSMDSLPDMDMVQEELSRIAMEKAGCKVGFTMKSGAVTVSWQKGKIRLKGYLGNYI